MAYFNHAFTKMFLGTGTTRNTAGAGGGIAVGAASATNPHSTGGFITTTNTTTETLGGLGTGYFGVFDSKSYQSLDVTETDFNCCPIIIASSSVFANDKIGPFHGGYAETNKSKTINPKYVRRFYRVDSCEPRQATVHLGVTPATTDANTPGCEKEFLCGETYYLRIDIKGSPALRFANHNIYRTLDAYTGCCADEDAPDPVNGTNVFIAWALQILNDQYLKDFVKPIVYDEAGDPWFATAADAVAAGWPATQLISLYDTTTAHTPGSYAGMTLIGAYVDTTFGNCSFYVTDHFEKEPITVLASLVDYKGDPCEFEGLCFYTECLGRSGQGFGETVIRDLIKSESYLQNFFHTDVRIREITQGDNFFNAINRGSLYTRYYIQHSVPRYNNPTGVFDNDQYLLEVITNGENAAFETFMENWLGSCQDCVALEEVECGECEIVPIPEFD